jgi:hypothetical protein
LDISPALFEFAIANEKWMKSKRIHCMFAGYALITWLIHGLFSQFSGCENHVRYHVLIDLSRNHNAKKTQLLKRGPKPGMFHL